MKEADFCSVKDTQVTGERRHLKRRRPKLDPHPQHTALKHKQRKGAAIAECPSVTVITVFARDAVTHERP